MRKTQFESWEMEWFQAHDRFQAQWSFWSNVQIETKTKILIISGKKSFIKARNPWIKTNSRGTWSKRVFSMEISMEMMEISIISMEKTWKFSMEISRKKSISKYFSRWKKRGVVFPLEKKIQWKTFSGKAS